MSDMFDTLLYGLLFLITIVYIVMWTEDGNPTKHSSAPLFITATVWCFTLVIGPFQWLSLLDRTGKWEMFLPAMLLHSMLVVTTAFILKAIPVLIGSLVDFLEEEEW